MNHCNVPAHWTFAALQRPRLCPGRTVTCSANGSWLHVEPARPAWPASCLQQRTLINTDLASCVYVCATAQLSGFSAANTAKDWLCVMRVCMRSDYLWSWLWMGDHHWSPIWVGWYDRVLSWTYSLKLALNDRLASQESFHMTFPEWPRRFGRWGSGTTWGTSRRSTTRSGVPMTLTGGMVQRTRRRRSCRPSHPWHRSALVPCCSHGLIFRNFYCTLMSMSEMGAVITRVLSFICNDWTSDCILATKIACFHDRENTGAHSMASACLDYWSWIALSLI